MGQYTLVGVSSMKRNTVLFKLSKKLKSLLCTSTDNLKRIFNTKGQHSVEIESRVMVPFL